MNNLDLNEKIVNVLDFASLEIYDYEKSASYTQDNLEELFNDFPLLKELFPTKEVLIIGEINKGYSVFYGNAFNNACKVFSFDPVDYTLPLIPLANDIKCFYLICDFVEKTFDAKKHRQIRINGPLDKTTENKELRNLVLSEIENISPDADLSYWDYILFNYLTLYMS